MNKLINFQKLSLIITGKRDTLRPNKIPKKYKEKVDKLFYYINCWEKDIELVDKNKYDNFNEEFFNKLQVLQESTQNTLKSTKNTLNCIDSFISSVDK